MRRTTYFVLSGVVISVLALIFAPAPYIWLYLLWFVIFAYSALKGGTTIRKISSLYICVLFLAFSTIETYLWWKSVPSSDIPSKHEEYPKNIIDRTDDLLGYAPRKNTVATHFKKHGEKVDFLVDYTIDSNRLRKAPSYTSCKKSILFFGGSFTFGSGVEDYQTMPYLVGLETIEEYCVYNFGFRGYGPHQMLSSVENELVKSIVKTAPKYVIYQFIPSHVKRVSGLAGHDKHGPRYILQDEGLIYTGHFDEYEKVSNLKLPNQLMKSLMFSELLTKYNKRKYNTNKNINLFIEIVDYSRRLIELQFKNSEFHVLFWNHTGDTSKNILERLKSKGFRVHLISDILPDYYNKRISHYSISKYDQHPNPIAHKIIAKYVTTTIINQKMASIEY